MLPIRLVPGGCGAWMGGDDLVPLQGLLAEKLLYLSRAVGVGKASSWLGKEGAGGGKTAKLQPVCLPCPPQRPGKRLDGQCWG